MRYIKSILIISVLGILTLGCTKTCDFPKEDAIKGVILEEGIVYPVEGYMTDVYPNGLHVDGSHMLADKFEVAINNETKQAFSNVSGSYHILGYRTVVKCDVYFEREVLIDHANQIVTYNITIKECDKGCDELRTVENYVIVPAFPASYTLIVNEL